MGIEVSQTLAQVGVQAWSVVDHTHHVLHRQGQQSQPMVFGYWYVDQHISLEDIVIDPGPFQILPGGDCGIDKFSANFTAIRFVLLL